MHPIKKPLIFIYRVIASRICLLISNSSILKYVYRKIVFLSNKKDFKSIPIYINNRDRYTYLKDLIIWLDNNGFTNYYVIDNNSTFQETLNYYTSELKDKVIYLNQNVGHWAIWNKLIYLKHPFSFYVYTDSDIIPVLKDHPDLFRDLYNALRSNSFALKSGSAITIADIPDFHSKKSEILKHENSYWQNEIEENIYKAGVDTTLALYMPLWHGVGRWSTHLRIAGNCLIKHQPWYINDKIADKENDYYVAHAKTATHWTRLPNN